MRTRTVSVAVCLLVLGLGTSVANAQRGMGDTSGVASQAVKPKTVSLEGSILSVETGPCKQTTGRATVGTHVMLQAKDGKQLNVHLGPDLAVAPIARQLPTGTGVIITAFRTEKMPEDHYVAQSITVGEKVLTLRDQNLRPVWAGQGARYIRGQGGYQMGPGYGRGYGQGANGGWGRGRGYGRGRGHGGGRW